MYYYGMIKCGDKVLFPKKVGDYYTKELKLVADRGVITEINNDLYTIRNDKGKYFVCKKDVVFADFENSRDVEYTDDMVYTWKPNSDNGYSWFGTGFDMIDFKKPAPVVKKKKRYNIAAIVALKSKNDNGKSGRKNK